MDNKGVLKVEFSTIIIPFYTQALVKMGLRKDPLTGEISENLDEAKNLIDLLDLLKEKTEGNLTQEEENILNSTLTHLKTEYLKRKNIIKWRK